MQTLHLSLQYKGDVVPWTFLDTLSTMRLMASTRLDCSLLLGHSFLVGSLTNAVDSSGVSPKSLRVSGALAFLIELGCFGGGFDPSTGNSTSNFGC